jgi:hypothetical protein
MYFVAATSHLYGGAGTLVSNLAKGLPRMPSEKAEHFHGAEAALSLDGKIIPRILFSANKIVRVEMGAIFLVFMGKSKLA